MAYKEIDESSITLIDSVSSFIEMIRQVKETKEAQDGTSTELYFRGQETEFWDIEPSIFRDDMLSIGSNNRYGENEDSKKAIYFNKESRCNT